MLLPKVTEVDEEGVAVDNMVTAEDHAKYGRYMQDFYTLAGDRTTRFPHAYGRIISCIKGLHQLLLDHSMVGAFFNQTNLIPDLAAIFMANISIELCALLDTGKWTFQQLREAFKPLTK